MYLRYLGVLGILGECSPYVLRETITMAMEDAASHHPLRVVRTLKRVEIEPYTSGRDAFDRTGE